MSDPPKCAVAWCENVTQGDDFLFCADHEMCDDYEQRIKAWKTLVNRLAECVGRTAEELADENYDWDRETTIGVIHDVRLHLHEAGIEIPEV